MLRFCSFGYRGKVIIKVVCLQCNWDCSGRVQMVRCMLYLLEK